MEIAQQVSSLVLGLRKKEISCASAFAKNHGSSFECRFSANIQHVQDLILAEVNVKELEILEEGNGMLVKSIKPNFKTIGPKYGKQMKDDCDNGFSNESRKKILQQLKQKRLVRRN
jgi:isoleucyl-tRNA synthetase